ncbi:hypothetical protein [Streptomyces sp. PSAA01]|uniref:hypothetical protein n=1 Tax=Streptomyces sp. PSAA01 TaxID=2912762 RepID=UPI001F34486F|nr:hypothetical protein [Streptomyces sp. PSAA01]MCG0284428.1 hypothetical protein [Streptomyces sp. PSAA01]
MDASRYRDLADGLKAYGLSSRALTWAPPHGDTVEMVEVGQYWDAVRAPVEIGERALELLGAATGAVIADYAQMYWLLAPGSAQYWRRLPKVQALSATPTSYMGVPPIGHTAGPVLHWRIPLGPDRYLTDSPLLRGALAQAVAAELGTDREIGR